VFCNGTAAISPGERYVGGLLMHLDVEQIVHAGDDQAVYHQGDCEDSESRQYVGIHKISCDGFLKPFIAGDSADELGSVRRERREPAAHYPRD
jgi:hypothetical protein